MSNKTSKSKRPASAEADVSEKKQRIEKCVEYKTIDSPSKIPKCKEGQLIGFSDDQLTALRSKTAIKGKIAIINVDAINRFDQLLYLLSSSTHHI